MSHFFFFTYLIITSVIFALLEINIEGQHGWAGNLPTWFKKINLPKIFQKLHIRKPLTGYHLFLWIFIALLLHAVFLTTSWSMTAELKIVSFYILLLTLEDFFWFVFNPHFGLKKFSSLHIHWHHDWLLKVPTVYWFSTITGIAIYMLSLQ